jgi:hypothetical protein
MFRFDKYDFCVVCTIRTIDTPAYYEHVVERSGTFLKVEDDLSEVSPVSAAFGAIVLAPGKWRS